MAIYNVWVLIIYRINKTCAFLDGAEATEQRNEEDDDANGDQKCRRAEIMLSHEHLEIIVDRRDCAAHGN